MLKSADKCIHWIIKWFIKCADRINKNTILDSYTMLEYLIQKCIWPRTSQNLRVLKEQSNLKCHAHFYSHNCLNYIVFYRHFSNQIGTFLLAKRLIRRIRRTLSTWWKCFNPQRTFSSHKSWHLNILWSNDLIFQFINTH